VARRKTKKKKTKVTANFSLRKKRKAVKRKSSTRKITKRKTKVAGINNVLKNYKRYKDNLIPLLQGVQKKQGYISEDAVKSISKYLNMSENVIYGVTTFYTQFRFTRPGDHTIKICQGTACHVRGCKRIMNETIEYLGIKPGETTLDYKFSMESVACFGSCALSPVVVIDGTVHGRMTAQKTKKLLKGTK